jgi:tRNA 2-thiocytidine biosynthesis protein TtcA
MLKTVGTYGLLDEGDSVLVGLSGGKDSYTLFELLWEARKKAPVRFDIVGVHLDQGQPGYDGSAMKGWLDRFGAPYEIVREDTYSIVKQKMNEAGANTGSTLCAPCSRLRRGILYTTAARLGCNKIALGHHRDDALETLLLNLLYGGKLQAMPATYTTNDERFEVIRPLIECAERDIARYAAAARFPIIPCNLCGSQSGLKRVRVARLLDALEKETPDVRATMLGALKNVRPTHLLDREVAQSWSATAGRYKPRR